MLAQYEQRAGVLPSRIVIHKTSTYAPEEEEGFLRYDRDRAPQPRLLDPGEVDSPELDRSVGDRIEPREEPDEGGLPRADGADDAEDPAGSHREGHVVKGGARGALVPEA